ncbi:cupin domain-containing protein [Pseudogracilibacillus auburnensis]|uniref:XRE family transcriptional regulator n=1 Tax=Pseudogracilibacillus auburnensis TaxID=1494959 RepID=A0A2V3VT21_9BACI|nr:cupin domain-containing protein [Pseudogracilibacillus auburnensis]MBO1001262.1 cupin domain-containing protein [Pseudogracilibacillus auburnensis]PXW83858.1 XRE family transcriptional regulator [Pseudogracilibacillus auburnensis]
MFDGGKIRELRMKRGYSLKTLAEKSNVSISIISKIERNNVDPSVTILYRICNGLDVSITELLGEDSGSSNILRKEDRNVVVFPQSNSKYELLTPVYNGDLEMIKIYLEAGQSDKNLVSHSGEECGVVLEGSMTVILDNKEHILNEGDSICFNSGIPHRFFNHTNKQSISIWAMNKK